MFSYFVTYLFKLFCFRDDHQIILFMFEHVTRIQRKQNGGIMMILVDATVLILLAEDSPTEKMSTLIIQSLNFNL